MSVGCRGTLVSNKPKSWMEPLSNKIQPIIIGLVEGKIYRKPLIFPLNMGFSCQNPSLQPIHRNNQCRFRPHQPTNTALGLAQPGFAQSFVPFWNGFSPRLWDVPREDAQAQKSWRSFGSSSGMLCFSMFFLHWKQQGVQDWIQNPCGLNHLSWPQTPN